MNLPEWPEEDNGEGAAIRYWCRTASAALARMEALVELVREHRHGIRKQMTIDEALAMDELLAACKREER